MTVLAAQGSVLSYGWQFLHCWCKHSSANNAFLYLRQVITRPGFESVVLPRSGYGGLYDRKAISRGSRADAVVDGERQAQRRASASAGRMSDGGSSCLFSRWRARFCCFSLMPRAGARIILGPEVGFSRPLRTRRRPRSRLDIYGWSGSTVQGMVAFWAALNVALRGCQTRHCQQGLIEARRARYLRWSDGGLNTLKTGFIQSPSEVGCLRVVTLQASARR